MKFKLKNGREKEKRNAIVEKIGAEFSRFVAVFLGEAESLF